MWYGSPRPGMAARVGMQPPVFAAGSAAVKLGHREMKFRSMVDLSWI